MIGTKQTLAKVNALIDFKMGLLGAIFMGSLVFWINFDHGWDDALVASLKQFFYTLFFGGLFLKMAENIATSINNRIWGIFAGGFFPMVLTAIMTFTMHSLKGTPEPFNSTLPTIFLAWLSFSIWSWEKTRSDSSNSSEF
jgi:hypothetical protein